MGRGILVHYCAEQEIYCSYYFLPSLSIYLFIMMFANFAVTPTFPFPKKWS